MSEFCLLIGTNTRDTTSTWTNIWTGNNCHYGKTDEIPPTSRGFAAIPSCDTVYVVSHGSETEIGDESNEGTTIAVDDAVDYFNECLKEGATVHFYVCDSLAMAKKLKFKRPGLEIYAADGTPALTYNQQTKEVEDSSGNYQLVLLL